MISKSEEKVTKIKRALISVSDKSGIIEFAQGLIKLGVEIISTGGTYKHLREHGIPAIEVSTITNFPEILDGRVKTLHPAIHGGILAKRNDIKHTEQLTKHAITTIDLVCINLYPFVTTMNNPNATFDEIIENIDIGGPAMIRASSKNYNDVIIITAPKYYTTIIEQLNIHGDISSEQRLELAQIGFGHTAYYDSSISNHLATYQTHKFPEQMTTNGTLRQQLRYGENAHQVAALYTDSGNIKGLLASFVQLQGKELSYNNIVDSDAAWECVKQFNLPTCVIVKHANPCAVAIGNSVLESYQKSFKSDPVSSFGGIIAFNSNVDDLTANALINQFCEVIIAPSYDKSALTILAKKTNIRVLCIDLVNNTNKFEYKRVGGGLLIQTPENKSLDINALEVVSTTKPTSAILQDLLFAWNVARFVKSNAIVLVKNQQTIGIGAGQMSRIDSTKIAKAKAVEFGFDTTHAVVASDAFFPFRDNVDLLAQMKVSAIIQPGGSIKDQEVFAAADEHGIIMVKSGYRAFRH
jgi:phosphoribosylaminoimidazolecarboxamide formyltransferase/IMP cyclohydrolase